MLERLRLRDFKSFSDETLQLGPFSVVVGANASGKSNIRDSLRFLHGIGRGYSIADIVGGKYGVGGQVEWEQLRGGTQEIVRFGLPHFHLNATLLLGALRVEYAIRIGFTGPASAGRLGVLGEGLRSGEEMIYLSPIEKEHDEVLRRVQIGDPSGQHSPGVDIRARPDQPAIGQIVENKRVASRHKEIAKQTLDALGSMRFLDLSPEAMRKPAFPGQVILGDGGENLPTVLEDICTDRQRKDTLADWLRELTPMDVRDFSFPRDPVTGQVHLVIQEGEGQSVSAYSASDGSLRFLAMLAALLGPDPANVYVFEEIDNGIHPARLRLLVELIEGQTKKRGLQVVTTTHSSEMLGMLGDEAFEKASLVCRLDDRAVIRRLAELPNAREHRRELGRLHMGGWMENAVAFTEDQVSDS